MFDSKICGSCGAPMVGLLTVWACEAGEAFESMPTGSDVPPLHIVLANASPAEGPEWRKL